MSYLLWKKPRLRDVASYNCRTFRLVSAETILDNPEMYLPVQFYRLSSATIRAPRSNPKFRPPDAIGNAGYTTSDSQLGLAKRKKRRSTCTSGKSATASALDPPPTSRVGIFRRFVKVPPVFLLSSRRFIGL